MQYIDHWPDMTKLALPESVAQSLHDQLIEPFDTEVSAEDFWKETFCTLIILNDFDSIKQLEKSEIWSQIESVLTYPEYTEPLTMDYQLMVAIVNDAGTGIFLVIPPELSTVISTKQVELNNNI